MNEIMPTRKKRHISLELNPFRISKDSRIRTSRDRMACLSLITKMKAVATDMDGVLTDGRKYYSAKGLEILAFDARDGLGFELLQRAGLHCAVITSCDSPIVRRRMKDLEVSDFFVVFGTSTQR